MAVPPAPRSSYRPYLLMFILNLAIVAGILYLLRRETPRPVIVTQPSPRSAVTTDALPTSQITVIVGGAVNQPGTLTLGNNARLADALQGAGGVRSDADLSRFDLTRALKQGETINIPARPSNSPVANNLVSNTPDVPNLTPAHVSPVNLNTASLEQLVSLPGIGPALAQRILDHRAANGPFKSIESLKDVRGIGDAVLDGLKQLVTVE